MVDKPKLQSALGEVLAEMDQQEHQIRELSTALDGMRAKYVGTSALLIEVWNAYVKLRAMHGESPHEELAESVAGFTGDFNDWASYFEIYTNKDGSLYIGEPQEDDCK